MRRGSQLGHLQPDALMVISHMHNLSELTISSIAELSAEKLLLEDRVPAAIPSAVRWMAVASQATTKCLHAFEKWCEFDFTARCLNCVERYESHVVRNERRQMPSGNTVESRPTRTATAIRMISSVAIWAGQSYIGDLLKCSIPLQQIRDLPILCLSTDLKNSA